MNARAAALHCEPLQSLSEVTETTEEFRRVRVEGEMIKNSIRVGPKVRTSEVSNNEKIAGYDLITPMREKRNKNARRKGVWPFGGGGGSNDDVNDDDVVALVNRGFAERAFEDAKGGMCLKTIGVVRKGDVKGYFTPENVPEKNVWHYVDVRGIGKAKDGLETLRREFFSFEKDEYEGEAFIETLALKTTNKNDSVVLKDDDDDDTSKNQPPPTTSTGFLITPEFTLANVVEGEPHILTSNLKRRTERLLERKQDLLQKAKQKGGGLGLFYLRQSTSTALFGKLFLMDTEEEEEEEQDKE